MSQSTAQMTCDHPDFSYVTTGTLPGRPFVFIFNRRVLRQPTPEQLAEYQANRLIVEAHRGRMLQQEDEIAGKNPSFTTEDVKEAVASVLRSNPNLKFVTTWNGVGFYSLSVAFR